MKAGFVLLSKEDALKIEKQPRKSGGPRLIYIFKCKYCDNQIKVRGTELKTRTGLCISCSHKKVPYLSIFNSIIKDWRKLKNTLTFKQFIQFTKIKECYYCGDNIHWNEYGTVNGKFISRKYFLDRKNNNIGYSRSNCVVCCSSCNKFKLSKNHDEFINLCKKIARNRGN